MKRILLLLAIAWLGVLVPRTQAAELTVDLFYDQLSPYGDWVDAGEYGYAWHPRDVGEDWRPYTEGHWAYTDAGWTFVSEEPYSWAVYHYGRWTKVVDVGWIWVPGREWGPAWVSFRHSKRYVGWAPLPPEASFGREVTTISSWSDSYYDIGPTQYAFVEVRNFGAPRLRQYIAPPRENITIINQTTNITNIRVENNIVYNGGPDYNVITRETAQPIQRLRLDRQTDVVVSDRNAFRTTVQGDSLRVVAPTIQTTSTTVVAPKNVRRLDRVEVNHGWRDAGDPAATEKLRAKLQAEAKVPAGLPPKPTFQKASATAAGGATEAPSTTQPGSKPPTTAETAATPSPKAPTTGNEKATSSTKPNSRNQSPAATDPNSGTTTATSPDKMTATPSPTDKTAKGKKGQRPGATPAPTAATDPNSANPTATATDKTAPQQPAATPAPNAKTAKGKKGQRPAIPAPNAAATDPNAAPNGANPEKPAEPQPGDLPPKGKKGQRTPPAPPAPRNDSPTATPPGQKNKPQRDDAAPGVTPSRPGRPESATEAPGEKPQAPAEKPAPKNRPNAAPAPRSEPAERAPEAKPERKEQKAQPAEMEKRPNPANDRGPEARPKERGNEGADARPKERAPEAPKARQQSDGEPQSAAPRGPAPQAPGHDKGQKKEDKKGDKKPEGAPQ